MFNKETFIAITILFAIMIPVALFTDFRPPGFTIILFYLLIYGGVSGVISGVAYRRRREVVPQPQFNWPTSGPIGRYGQTGLVATFTLSGLLALLNPCQLTQIILQALGNFYLQIKENEAPQADSYRNRATYTLPFTRAWLVYNGGTTPQTSHSWDVVTQRFALDFVQVDGEMHRHGGRGTVLTEYYCYDQPILAAAPGTVIKVQDGVRNAPFVGYGIVDFLAHSFVGNHVIIRHADGEYGFYAHLIPGSISVAADDVVARGQQLGRCGHSGHSSEPHLHFHLQDRPNFYFARGLPIRFAMLSVNGELVENVHLTVGDMVQPSSAI